jgi:hypothetical protein
LRSWRRALFVATHLIDRAVFEHRLTLPGWLMFGSADAARQILRRWQPP